MTSIILVNFNRCSLTCRALDSLLVHAPDSQVIVVDNGSTDRSVQEIRTTHPHAVVIELDHNTGFSAANNAGVRRSSGDRLFFLNNDAYLTGPVVGALEELLDARPEVGICAPRLENEDGAFQLSTGPDPSMWNEWKTKRLQSGGELAELSVHKGTPIDVDWVSGAALLIRSDLFKEIGGFDEGYFMYFEDVDLCHRVRHLGKKVLYVPDVSVRHARGGTVAEGNTLIGLEYRKSQIRYYSLHRSLFALFLLRAYLLVKFGHQWYRSDVGSTDKQLAGDVMKVASSRWRQGV